MKPPQLLRTKRRKTGQLNEETKRVSEARSKREVARIVKANSWTEWITFNFGHSKCPEPCPKTPDICKRYDMKTMKTLFKAYIEYMQRKHGSFEYLVVPEYHEKGTYKGAIHFHMMAKDCTIPLQPAMNTKKTSKYYGQPLLKNGRQIYSLPDFKKKGMTTAVKIDQDPVSIAKVGTYLGKYITKAPATTFGEHRYWVSNNIKRPQLVVNPEFVLNTPKTVKRRQPWANDFGLGYVYHNTDLQTSLNVGS